MSPFEIFRRNLKPLMVALTGLALFAFVVLPAIETYMRRGGGPGAADAELASFDGKPLTRNRVAYLTQNHQSTVRFLRELAEETIRRGGAPQTPGFAYDSRNRQIQSIGIDEQPSELGTVRTLQFANEAKKAGFELDDTAIGAWLYSFTDQGTVPEGEMLAMLMQSTRNQMGKYHLYEQLRSQLLAELYQRGNVSGLSVNGQIPVVTPVEQWDNFLKLNRQATVNTYGVLVADFLDKTDAMPSEAAIAQMYEAGKDRFPDEQSADPGFRRRETATFEYLVADRQAFIDREAEKFSEEQLRAEYERRLAGGDFQMPATGEDSLDLGDEDQPAMTPQETTTENEPATTSETPESETSEEPSETKPADDPAPATDAGDGEAGVGEAGDGEAKDESPAPENPAPENPAPENPTPENPDQSRASEPSAIRLVVFQDESGDNTVELEPAQVETPAVEEVKEPAAKKKNSDSGKKKKAQQKADPQPKEAQPEEPKSEEPTPDEPKSEEPKSDEPTPDEPTPEDSPGNDQPMVTDGEAAEEPSEPKVESFEDVRQQIAFEMAEPEARRKIDAALNEAVSQMRRYFNLMAIHESNLKIGRASEAPAKPDLKALAEEYGLQYETIGPHSIVSLRNEPIAQSSEFSGELSQPGPPFTAMMFGVSTNQAFLPKQQLYFPLRTADLQAGKSYVSWKTDETDANTPTLEEARDEVVMAIRMEQAREMARLEAVKLADAANEGKPLAELIPEDKKSNLKEGLGPFSWMVSFGFGGAFLGNVPELDSVGEEFMAETFRTKEGQYGVAANLPERVVYVIQPSGFQPSIEELRRRFKEPRERMMALLLGTEDVQSVMRGFYEAVDERTGFNFAVAEEE